MNWFEPCVQPGLLPGSEILMRFILGHLSISMLWAVGDEQLSEAAEEQLIGEAGYFRGKTGLLDDYGNTADDRFWRPCDL